MHRYPELFMNSTRRGITPKTIFEWTGTQFPTFGTHWTSTDARWAINGEWLWLNYNDWNSSGCYLKPGFIFIPDGKVIFDMYCREDNSSMSDFSVGVTANVSFGGSDSLCYFNWSNTTASFFGSAFSYQGAMSTDIHVYVELQNGLQQLWVQDVLRKTLYYPSIFPIIGIYFGFKQYVKVGRIKIISERNW